MSDKTSAYPISKVIAKIIMNSGYTPLGYLLAVVDSKAEAGLSDLESWLEKGEGDEGIISRIASFEPGEAEKLRNAVAETAAMKAAGVDPVAYENERIEKIERDRFKPFIRAQGELRLPSQITGACDLRTIRMPAAILKLPLEEQLAKVQESMAEYRQEY